MTVQLAMRKNDTRITARWIQWWTESPYSHCELVVNGLCYSSSALDGGVRSKYITLNPDKWDVIDVPWADATAIEQYFRDTDHYRYGWVSLITSQMFNLNKSHASTEFCSQWCGSALGLPNSPSLSPKALHALVVYINRLMVLKDNDLLAA